MSELEPVNQERKNNNSSAVIFVMFIVVFIVLFVILLIFIFGNKPTVNNGDVSNNSTVSDEQITNFLDINANIIEINTNGSLEINDYESYINEYKLNKFARYINGSGKVALEGTFEDDFLNVVSLSNGVLYIYYGQDIYKVSNFNNIIKVSGVFSAENGISLYFIDNVNNLYFFNFGEGSDSYTIYKVNSIKVDDVIISEVNYGDNGIHSNGIIIKTISGEYYTNNDEEEFINIKQLLLKNKFDYNELQNFKKTVEFNEYIIVHDISSNYGYEYFLLNKKDKSVNILFGPSSEKLNIYDVYSEELDQVIGVVVPKYKMVNIGYRKYNCFYSTGDGSLPCNRSETVIVKDSDNKVGLLSLKDGSLLLKVEYDAISEMENGNFIITKNNKSGVFSLTKGLLFDLKYDYIGYSKNFGYIVFDNDNALLYDDNLKVMDINLDEYFLTNFGDLSSDEMIPSIEFKDSYDAFFLSGSYLLNMDISRIKYKGNDLNGKQKILINKTSYCNGSKDYVYILKNNKFTLINENNFSINKDDIECFI